jgi:aminoglycoside phosphotransferase (APT) family kinase protein
MSQIKKSLATEPVVLLERIRKTFPELHWNTYTLNTDGWDHKVIILDDKIVFRFPDDAEYTALLRHEIDVLEILKPFVKIAIPHYSFIAPDRSFAGYPIVPGKELKKSTFDALESSQRQMVAAQLAEFLTTLHTLIDNSVDLSLVPASYVPGDQAELKKLVPRFLHEVLSDDDLMVVQQILDEVDELLSQNPRSVFLHGDLYSRHILWDETSKLLGVIDFSDMARGDPAIDFAELHEYGLDFVKEVYELYKGPKDSTFLDRAWTYQKWVSLYMMTDYFESQKTSFAVARETFDRIKKGRV